MSTTSAVLQRMCTKQPHMNTGYERQINLFTAKFCERNSVWYRLVLHEEKLTDVMTFVCISVCGVYTGRQAQILSLYIVLANSP